MRLRRVARGADEPEHVPATHALTRPDPDGARLEVGVERKAAVAEIEDDVIAVGPVDRDAAREGAPSGRRSPEAASDRAPPTLRADGASRRPGARAASRRRDAGRGSRAGTVPASRARGRPDARPALPPRRPRRATA